MSEWRDDSGDLWQKQDKGISKNNQASVTTVAEGGTRVDEALSFWTEVGKGVHVGHDIIPQLLFLLSCQPKVDIILVGSHLLQQVLLQDGQTQRLSLA